MLKLNPFEMIEGKTWSAPKKWEYTRSVLRTLTHKTKPEGYYLGAKVKAGEIFNEPGACTTTYGKFKAKPRIFFPISEHARMLTILLGMVYGWIKTAEPGFIQGLSATQMEDAFQKSMDDLSTKFVFCSDLSQYDSTCFKVVCDVVNTPINEVIFKPL